MVAIAIAAPAYAARMRQVAFACAMVAAGLGATTVGQWLLGIAISIDGSLVDVAHIGTRALCLLLLGLAAVARHLARSRAILGRVGSWVAAIAGLLALATLAQHLLGINLGLDQLSTVLDPSPGLTNPAAMSALAAGCSVALAAATMLSDYETKAGHRPTEVLCFGVLAVMLAVFFGHLMNAEALVGVMGRLAGVSPATMIAMGLTCVALLGLHPDRGAMAPMVAEGVAGHEARLVLWVLGPFTILVLSALALGREAGWYDAAHAQALAFTAAVLLGVFAAWRSFSHLVDAERVVHIAVVESRRSEERFRTVFEAAPSGMFLVDAAGRIVMANARAEAKLGYERNQLAGQPVDSIVPERFRTEHPAHRGGYLSASVPRSMGLGSYLAARRRDGTEFPAEVALSPVETPEGQMVIVSLVDVSRRVEADQAIERLNFDLSRYTTQLHANLDALRDSQRRLQLALDHHRVGFWEWNLETRNLDWDENWRAVHGRSNGTPSHGGWLEIVHPDDRPAIAQALEQQLSQSGDGFQVEYRAMNDGGRLIWVCCRGRAVERAADGRPVRVLGTVEEITEWKRVEQLVERRNRELQSLLHVTSHDLREPLRAISGFSKILEDRYQARLDDTGRDYLSRVVRAASRLEGLISDIWTLSKARRVERPAAPVPVDRLIQEAVNRLDERIRETKAMVRVVKGAGDAQVDPTWVTQAAYNLVLNALKFAKPGEPPEVEIAPWPDPTKPTGLVVRDRGIGVAAEHSERIFRLFQRAVGREVEGTGAGLAIVREVAERHGGRAWVQNRAGGGSEFIMTFRE